MRSLLIKILLIPLSVVLTVGLLEVALRLAHYRERNHFGELMEYDALLGWRHRANWSTEIFKTEFNTTVQYNAHGLRGTDHSYIKPAGRWRIAVLGDSFVDGYTVKVQERITEVLEASLGPGFEVINLGVSAYSTDQELLLLETEGWRYQSDLVILAFHYNDIWMNGQRAYGRWQKPVFTVDADGKPSLANVPVPYSAPGLEDRFKVYNLVRAVVAQNRWLYSLAIEAGVAHGKLPDDSKPAPGGAAGGADEFMAYRRTETAPLERAWTITQTLLRGMKREAEQQGVGLVIFYVPSEIELSSEEWSNAHLPSDYDPGEVIRRLVGICKAEGIPYIEPSDRFREAARQGRLYYRYDPHWTAAGHRLAGRILAEYTQGFLR